MRRRRISCFAVTIWQKQIWTFFWILWIISCWIADFKVMIGDSGDRWIYILQSLWLSYILKRHHLLLLFYAQSFWQPSFFFLASASLIVGFEMCECKTKQWLVVWTKMFVEVVLMLLLYLSYFLADRLVLQIPEDTKCLSGSQTRNSDQTSYYYFWHKSNCFAFSHKDRSDTTTSICSLLASL